MNEVEKGNFNVNLESDGFDEIYILNESFNKMIKEIDNLTKEKVKAEIEALQYQINPHYDVKKAKYSKHDRSIN